MSLPVLPNDLPAQIADLQLRLAALERAGGRLQNASLTATPSAGATTGNKGLRIYDASGNERVRLGATDSDASPAAAQSLYGLSAKDASGVLRVLLGQTSSTPTYGLSTFDAAGVKRFTAGQIDGSTDGAAAYDAAGNVIWDTTGLVAVMKSKGSTTQAGTSTLSSTSNVDIGPTIGFTTTRTQNLLLMGMVSAIPKYSSTFGPVVNIGLRLSGSVAGVQQKLGHGTTIASGTLSIPVAAYFPIFGLAAGTYTATWYGNVLGGTMSCDLSQFALDVWQLGN